jgi:hypothetical protein
MYGAEFYQAPMHKKTLFIFVDTLTHFLVGVYRRPHQQRIRQTRSADVAAASRLPAFFSRT